ncbi:MAG: metal-dependent hydrolase [Clostridia bacterium]|nr:metal-dependent hydrolase [Clostridia bacterium]
MDPVTHGLIGLGISAFSGNPVALSSPVSLGCAIGAMAPDLDVVIRFVKDDYEYIKKHRGVSHSIPALVGFAFAITLGLSFFFPDMRFMEVLFWSFIGGVSHTVFDMMNSYGARLLMRKRKVNLLTLYDPIIWLLTLFLIFDRQTLNGSHFVALGVFTAYIGGRYLLRERARKKIINHYKCDHFEDITILPGLKLFYKWDYIIRTKHYSIVGDYNSLNQNFKETKRFKKLDHATEDLFYRSDIGRQFRDWSANYHLFRVEDKDKIILRAVDLRYYFNNDFMHKASLEIDKTTHVIESFFHPYKLETRIPIVETVLVSTIA